MSCNHMTAVSVGARTSIWGHREQYCLLCTCVCLNIWGVGGKGIHFGDLFRSCLSKSIL